jgi:protein ImuB
MVWLPDWPVTAWQLSEGLSPAADSSVAIVEGNRILACSAAARAQGVRRGQHRREAQATCPTLQVVAADPSRDQRLFDPLVTALEQVAPGVQVIRPGLAAIRSRGPARYHGGESAAATVLVDTLLSQNLVDVRVGLADGVFTAEQAAYGANPILVVPAGGSGQFLADLPINRLGDEDLARLLIHLGVRRLGDFAALDRGSVRDRFGDYGVRLHDVAGGRDARPVTADTPPADLARQIEFENAFDQAEPIVFSIRRTAEDFIANLGSGHQVCTELRVIITSENGEASERVWLHPTAFSVASVIDRVRWQLASAAGSVIASGVVKVRFEPVAIDAAYRHEPGLFGSGSDERVHHTLSRLQTMLGYDAVVTATVGGGRWLAERQVLVPWGERVVTPRPVDRPWPGQLPAPLPGIVFSFPRSVQVLAATGGPVSVDDRGNLSSPPVMLIDDSSEEQTRRRIVAWAGPWPIDERTWDPNRHRRACRFQALDAEQSAWLLVLDDGGSWWVEGRYD